MISHRIVNNKLNDAVLEQKSHLYSPVMRALTQLTQKKTKVIIAIDGRCASGKTTLAKEIQETFACNVIHMDDFFLPFEMRSKKRLAEVGGNVHYERLTKEILHQWINTPAKEISHQPYNCKTKSYEPPVTTPAKQLNIIEGVYSMHPSVIDFYDFKIFLTVDQNMQRKRLQKRNPHQLQTFIDLWIPLEEKYFNKTNIHNKSDLKIDTSHYF